jgi:predicted adenine nucleotide alpha hydrolase (AANH) superfamily ATPase
MLVHICCSVDSHYFLQKLQIKYPKSKLVAYFYDPNIHPYSEYQLRLLDVKRSCDMLNIELIEGKYNIDHWFSITKGLENEPEKGKRCSVCFEDRFEMSAKMAKEMGYKQYTSTLLTSPKKSLNQLSKIGENIGQKYGVEFVSVDFRKNGGTQEQFALAKQDKLYHQDYCGCLFALDIQRKSQARLADELISPINKQVLPESIEYRIKLYKKRLEYEEKGVKYTINRENFLNYRLFRGFIEYNKEIINSVILSYSTLKRKRGEAKVNFEKDGIYYFNRYNIKAITVATMNKLLGTSYKNTQELMNNPMNYEKEVELRAKIDISFFSLSPIIILDEICDKKYKFYIDAQIYEDVKEVLLKL